MAELTPVNAVGLHEKYRVLKRDEHGAWTGVDGFCFVLRPDRDPAALWALETYAMFTSDVTLARDLKDWINRLRYPTEDSSG